jgi:hypothetical protein
MNALDDYLELIVEPTYEEYKRNSTSVRHAYLACSVIYHTVDRAARPNKVTGLSDKWAEESLVFMLVREVALHFKHGQRHWVRKAKKEHPDALLITHPLGLEGGLGGLELHGLYFQVRDALFFIRKKASLAAPKAQAPLSPQLP